ncbi:MAG: HD domain-containing protein [Pirellulaceae bacterium]|nr:HD domain-containing protein [Pirellulaceae bacterium]
MQTLAPSRATRQFIPISPLLLSSKNGLSVDVFLKVDANATPKLYCSRRLQVGSRQLQLLLDAGISKLYIESESYKSYLSDLHSNWESILADDSPIQADRTALMYEVVRVILGEQFKSDDASSIVRECQKLSGSLVNVLRTYPATISQLHDLMHHDYALCTHSSNVAIYIALLARELSFSDSDVEQIVVGALVHDIGKLQTQDGILAKPERLDDFEYREVKKHPSVGLRRLLSNQQLLSYGQLMMVYQHHEKLNGSGYPVGIPDAEIHPWAKMCAVIDTFEALTSHRPQRKPVSHETALAVLENLSRTELDAEIVQCWKSLVRRPVECREDGEVKLHFLNHEQA